MSNVRILSKPTAEERTQVIDLLTEAFWDHILIVNVLDGDLSLIKPCMAACTYVAERTGEIHVISADPDSPESIDGVTLWFPPGSEFIPTEESGWFDVVSKVPPEVAAWWGPLFGSQDRQIEELYGQTGSRDAWYLFYIGVKPALQHKGLGSQLMKYAVEKADSVAARVMVNTSALEKTRFYEANGLKNMGAVRAESPRGVAWDQYLMVRDPPDLS